MKLRTRITLMAAPVIIAGSILAGPAASAPFETPDDIVICPIEVDCGPDDPDPGDGPDEKIPPPPEEPPEEEPPAEEPPAEEPPADPEPETPDVPQAQPEAPRPGKPNFTG